MHLGDLYYHGLGGVERDFARAVELFEFAADKVGL